MSRTRDRRDFKCKRCGHLDWRHAGGRCTARVSRMAAGVFVCGCKRYQPRRPATTTGAEARAAVHKALERFRGLTATPRRREQMANAIRFEVALLLAGDRAKTGPNSRRRVKRTAARKAKS